VGAGAPASIHVRNRAISALLRRGSFGGITGTSSAAVTAWMRRLAALLPGTMAGPLLPPLSAAGAGVETQAGALLL